MQQVLTEPDVLWDSVRHMYRHIMQKPITRRLIPHLDSNSVPHPMILHIPYRMRHMDHRLHSDHHREM